MSSVFATRSFAFFVHFYPRFLLKRRSSGFSPSVDCSRFAIILAIQSRDARRSHSRTPHNAHSAPDNISLSRRNLKQHAISDLILEYNAYGFLDQLQRKWYGRVPCLEDSLNNLNKPNPLSIRAVAGVFIMLGCGFIVGILILIIEHVVFKYSLPNLREMPKDCFWKTPNLMFFSQVISALCPRRPRGTSSQSSQCLASCSEAREEHRLTPIFCSLQKLYRFVNTVELVSPHHSAKEIMHSLKEGQITSLFQKSLKRVSFYSGAVIDHFLSPRSFDAESEGRGSPQKEQVAVLRDDPRSAQSVS